MLKPIVTYLGLSLAATAALAQPARCSPGYQDASCVGYLANPPQVAPTCSTSAGWQTTSPAVWQGSHFSAPGCSYTPPPTCPGGTTQTGNPTWNGSSWSGLVCQPPSAPPSPLNASAGNSANYGYFTNALSKAGSQTFQLRSDGTWSVARSGFSSNAPRSTGSPTSGTWTTDATQAYEYTITKATKIYAAATTTPSTTTTAWTTLSNIALTAGTPGGGVPEGEGQWTINIRQKGTTSPVLTITVDLDTANGD